MTYLQDKKRKQKQIFAVFVSILVIGTAFFGVQKSLHIIKPVGTSINTSISTASQNVANSAADALSSKEAMHKKIEALEQEIDNQRWRDNMYYALEAELRAKNAILGSLSPKKPNAVVSRTTSVSHYGTFDVVTSSGVVLQNNVAISTHGEIVGVVSDVKSKDIAQILTIENVSEGVVARSASSSIEMKLMKDARGVMSAKLARDASVIEGERVIMFVRGVPYTLGTVAHISSDEKNPYKEVFVRIAANARSQYTFSIIEN